MHTYKWLISLCSLLFFACQKEILTSEPVIYNQSLGLHLSVFKLVLLQKNAVQTAFTARWTPDETKNAGSKTYTLEASVVRSDFKDVIDIGSTEQLSLSFTVQEFNKQIRKLVTVADTARVALRIRVESPNSIIPIAYSDATIIEVTPYQEFIKYSNSQILDIPGNYQNWIFSAYPQVIKQANSYEYEGYINFTDPSPQFLMVKKATPGNAAITYSNIGSNKLGLGGSLFSISEGAGIYRLKINMDSNTWEYAKIDHWGLIGTAVSPDPDVELVLPNENGTLSWSALYTLKKGDFRFRANNSNTIILGHNASEKMGVPNYNGESIHIDKPGNYAIRLHLTHAGNYMYSVEKIYIP